MVAAVFDGTHYWLRNNAGKGICANSKTAPCKQCRACAETEESRAVRAGMGAEEQGQG